ncbi:MAG: signal peptidase I, partial [Armatimonadota bacterium]
MLSRELIDKLARTPQSQVLLYALGLTLLRLVLFPYLMRTLPHLRSGSYKVARFFNEAADSIVYASILIFFVIRPFVFQTFTIPSGSMVPTLLVGDFIGINKAVYRYTNPQRFDTVVFRPPVRATMANQVDEAGNVNVDFIKRLIGLPGDVVELRQGELFINGKRFDQPWVHLMRNVPGSLELYEDLPPEIAAGVPKASFKLVRRGDELIPLNYDEFDVNASQNVMARPNGIPPYSIAEDYSIADPAEGLRLKESPAQPIPPGHYLFMGDNRLNSFDGRGWGLVERSAI